MRLLASLLILSNMAYAIDITTHCACKKVRVALQEAVPLNHFKFALQQVSYHESITPADYAAIITQAQQMAQQYKAALENTAATTASRPNHRDLAVAITASIGGAYIISSCIASLYYKVSFADQAAWYFFPLQKYIDEKLHKNGLALSLWAVQMAATIPAMYGIIWALRKVGHKGRTLAALREKIANLDAISTYLQELHSAQSAAQHT